MYEIIGLEKRKKMKSCTDKKTELSKEINNLKKIMEMENILESVQELEGLNSLSQNELTTITKGMDKTDYRKYGKCPRFLDLERLLKEVIEFKKLYPGWLLEDLVNTGQYDTLPPQTFYRYTYKTPQGHLMSNGGMQLLKR